MELPAVFPNPERNVADIQAMLERVRSLDPAARARLSDMLDNELDMPYLDVIERQYAEAFRRLAPASATQLRGRFVYALTTQREFLLGEVRKVLQEPVVTDAIRSQPDAHLDAEAC